MTSHGLSVVDVPGRDSLRWACAATCQNILSAESVLHSVLHSAPDNLLMSVCSVTAPASTTAYCHHKPVTYDISKAAEAVTVCSKCWPGTPCNKQHGLLFWPEQLLTV